MLRIFSEKNVDYHGVPVIEKNEIKMEMTLLDDQKNITRSLLSYSSLGIEMGLCVVIGLAAGHYLDKYFTTYPYLTFIFMFFGIVAAFRAVYSAYKRLKREDERDNRQ